MLFKDNVPSSNHFFPIVLPHPCVVFEAILRKEHSKMQNVLPLAEIVICF